MPRTTLEVKNAAKRDEYDFISKKENSTNYLNLHKQGKRPEHLVRLLSTFYFV